MLVPVVTVEVVKVLETLAKYQRSGGKKTWGLIRGLNMIEHGLQVIYININMRI